MDRFNDPYDMYFNIFAQWLPRIDPLIGFPVKALHPSVLRKEYLIALSLIGLTGSDFEKHCLWYRRYLRSLGVRRPPEDYYKEPGFLNEEYVHFMLRDRKIRYYPDYPEFRSEYGTLEELGLDVPTVLNYWREHQSDYTIRDVEFHPDGRVKYFKFVGSL